MVTSSQNKGATAIQNKYVENKLANLKPTRNYWSPLTCLVDEHEDKTTKIEQAMQTLQETATSPTTHPTTVPNTPLSRTTLAFEQQEKDLEEFIKDSTRSTNCLSKSRTSVIMHILQRKLEMQKQPTKQPITAPHLYSTAISISY